METDMEDGKWKMVDGSKAGSQESGDRSQKPEIRSQEVGGKANMQAGASVGVFRKIDEKSNAAWATKIKNGYLSFYFWELKLFPDVKAFGESPSIFSLFLKTSSIFSAFWEPTADRHFLSSIFHKTSPIFHFPFSI